VDKKSCEKNAFSCTKSFRDLLNLPTIFKSSSSQTGVTQDVLFRFFNKSSHSVRRSGSSQWQPYLHGAVLDLAAFLALFRLPPDRLGVAHPAFCHELPGDKRLVPPDQRVVADKSVMNRNPFSRM